MAKTGQKIKAQVKPKNDEVNIDNKQIPPVSFSPSASYYDSSGSINPVINGPTGPTGPYASNLIQGVSNIQNVDDNQKILVYATNVYKQLSERTDKVLEKVKQNENEVHKLTNQFIKEKAELKDLKQKIDSSRIQSIEVLGLFVALFTFVSLEFRAFQSATNIGIVSLTIVLLGALILFILILDLVIRYAHDQNTNKISSIWFSHFWFLLFIAIILIICGSVIIVKNDDTSKTNDAKKTNTIFLPEYQNNIPNKQDATTSSSLN